MIFAALSVPEQLELLMIPIVLVTAITIIFIVHHAVPGYDHNSAVALTTIICCFVMWFYAMPVWIGVSHHWQRDRVTTALEKRYPDVTFSRVNVSQRELEFSTETARCNAELIQLSGWLIRHGSVNCYTKIAANFTLEDSHQSDLTTEINNSLHDNTANKNTPYWIHI